MSSVDLIQGDSLDLEFRTTDRRDLSDFTCRLQVRDSNDVLAGIDRLISTYGPDNKSFIARITPSESGALALETYKLSAQLSNASTSEAVELNADLNITKQYNY